MAQRERQPGSRADNDLLGRGVSLKGSMRTGSKTITIVGAQTERALHPSHAEMLFLFGIPKDFGQNCEGLQRDKRAMVALDSEVNASWTTMQNDP